ncbi:MAG: hypothetical protein ACK4Q6_03100 [Tepidimonas ignava]|uniref:4Fe-4S ferredoxin-type domain-containing protein n=1 Tax=Tepidimonas ignava TaxID=114249 RepID=A0A4R3LFQ6_9BURK|nr:hypothetical protein [Tepidimonas ignava]TCS96306.1 hypothetical protein EDC36_11295 [Tepidimonas ignava]TSE23651.1 hypothetical protein Tigna_00345 [Tepidimonas ignava]
MADPQPGAVRWIHPDAPAKPAPGAPCNGCGVCCVWQPCPLGVVLSRRRRGACRALRWLHAEGRYVCGALHDPAAVFGWGHRPWARMLSRALRPAIARWIAAGRGCDCDVEVDRLDA